MNTAPHSIPIDSNYREANTGRTVSFQFIRASDMPVVSPKWLVQGIIEEDSLALIFGDPGCGKSFMAVDLACCIATDRPWHEHRIRKSGPVLYIAGEGHNGIVRRTRAWSIHNNTSIDKADLYISNGAAALCDRSSANAVANEIQEITHKIGPPALVVIDTLARNFGSGDENSTQDMNAFIASIDRIRSCYRCTILLIHHTGHSDKTRARGAISLKGALDAEFRMRLDKKDNIIFDATKMKDSEPPHPMAFRLRSVGIGLQDDDGNTVTSAVMERIGYEQSEELKHFTGKWQGLALEILRNLHDIQIEGDDNKSGPCKVILSTWRRECINRGMDRRRFSDVKKALTSSGNIRIEGDLVWLT